MDDQDTDRDVDAAAAVHAAKREVDGAIADLAAKPLDEAAAARMRQVLASAKLRKARRVLVRLQVPRRPHLSMVTDSDAAREESRSDADPDDEDRVFAPVVVAAGGVA